jgi:predicted PurR-regulated permease PerM
MKRGLKKAIIVALLVSLVYLVFKIKIIADLIKLVGVSFVFAYILRPLQRRFIDFGINRKIAAVIIILGILAFFSSICLFLIPNIIKDGVTLNNAFNNIRSVTDILYVKLEIINRNEAMKNVVNSIYEKINNTSESLLKNIFHSIFRISENILSYAVIPVIVYYFLSETPKICRNLLSFVPVKGRTVLRKTCNDIDKVLGRYIFSQFILCILITILTFIILIALKVEYPLLLALFNGLFNIIPYFGPLFGAIPAVLMALIKSPQRAIWTAVCLYVIQQIEGDIISPKITGDSINMHPLVVILLLIIGGKLGGFVGMVLAIPIGVIIKVIYDDLNYYIF